MKIRFLIIFFIISLLSPVFASDIEKFDYKEIKNDSKITINENGWTQKVSRKNNNYLIKLENKNIFSEYYSPYDDTILQTKTNYEFISEGTLYGYSNSDLKLYELILDNNNFIHRELSEDEIALLFPKFKLIRFSDFSQGTNSLKIKKKKRNLKIIFINDTVCEFSNYKFFSNNSKYKLYPLKGFIKINKKGMIQFSTTEIGYYDAPWYVLLVR